MKKFDSKGRFQTNRRFQSGIQTGIQTAEERRYGVYVAWCRLLRVAPAALEVWRDTLEKIADYQTSHKYSMVLYRY